MLVSLVSKNLFARKTRTVLTGLAIAASVALIVAMTSGIAAFEKSALGFMDRFMGAVDVEISQPGDRGGLDDAFLADLRKDPAVRHVMVRLNGETPLPTTRPSLFGNRVSVNGVDRVTDEPLNWMKLDAGRWFDAGESGAVIDQGMAEQNKLKVGDTLRLPGPNGPLEVPITGVVHKPGPFAAWSQTAYLPIDRVQRFFYGPDAKRRYSLLRVQYKPDGNAAEFLDRWRLRVTARGDRTRLDVVREKRDEMQKNFVGLRLLSMLGAAVTMLAAAFIIVATLSMGVAERQRTLAMLRAVGASKVRIAKLVVLEGVGLGVVGLLIGVPLGFVLNIAVALFLRRWFEITPTLDGLGVLMSTIVVMVTAVLASLLPAWRASRVDPLEALAAVAKPEKRGPPVLATVVGLLVIGIDPLLLHGPVPFGDEKAVRVYGHFFVGLPALMIGFFLLSPLFVWVIGGVLGPAIGWALRVPPSIVRQQFASGLWRLAGTCSALMVGLATLTVMQVQGRSALASWRLPDKFPDVFIFTKSANGLTPQQQEKVRHARDLEPNDVMPVGTFAPQVGGGLIGLLGTKLPGSTMFVAVDPQRAFRLMELDFRQGSAADASRLLAQGHYLLITDELHRMKNINKGDPFVLKNKKGESITFTIAGVVWSPGIDVMVSTFDVKQQFEQQSLACVFGSLDDAKNLFGVESVYIMSANFKNRRAAHEGMTGTTQADGEDTAAVSKESLIGRLREDVGDTSLFVADVRELKSKIQTNMGYLLTAASTIAWAAVLVASLGVANTIVAGIRTRMWQFGVLRSVGLLRGVLLRLVLTEAIVLGTTGAAMGLVCGALLTFDSRRLVEFTMGHYSPLTIPWGVLGSGVALVVGLSLIAAIVPAWRLARTQPLTLLQAGRAAT